ncbi:MAG: hypothetical protein H6625_00065 [Bdellovibrionaceae bacterium]|nr:hypothetical protein [Pseudobdellovibrionaceae bacterium]
MKKTLQPKSLKLKSYLFLMRIFLAIFFISTSVYAGKFDLLTGPFSLKAKVNDQEGGVSTVGAYNITYMLDLLPSLQLGAGYTVLMSNTFGGDLAFGIDAGLYYFPLTPSGQVDAKSINALLNIKPLWRPFVGGSFHQRQAQSTESSYAGFGVSLGVERALDYFFDLKLNLRHVLLSGPNGSTATETTFFIGASMPFQLGGK